jgi:WxcM-like protein
MTSTTVDDCQLLELPRIQDQRGNLTFIEGARHVPFEIKRMYYLYDVPGGAYRGAHGHRQLQEFIIAMSGSFTVVVDDGAKRRKIPLNRSYFGVYVPKLLWRELEDFSSGAVCAVLASTPYDESDYIRDYAEFLKAKGIHDRPVS